MSKIITFDIGLGLGLVLGLNLAFGVGFGSGMPLTDGIKHGLKSCPLN